MQKPSKMTVREFATRTNKLNVYLDKFLPNNADQRLPDNKILNLLEFGIPRSWKNQMTLQGFNPQTGSVIEFVKFCKRLKNMQDSTSDKVNSSLKTGNTRAGFPTKHTSKKHKLKHYQGLILACILHREGHSTEDCKTIQKWAKKQKTDYAQKKDYSEGKSNKWTKRSSSNKKFSKNNLNAM